MLAGRTKFRIVGCLSVVVSLAAIPVGAALAADARVTMACASDYFAYCSQHPSEGPAVRQCMRAAGPKLSKRCLNALVAAGEVSQSEINRRSASAR